MGPSSDVLHVGIKWFCYWRVSVSYFVLLCRIKGFFFKLDWIKWFFFQLESLCELLCPFVRMSVLDHQMYRIQDILFGQWLVHCFAYKNIRKFLNPQSILIQFVLSKCFEWQFEFICTIYRKWMKHTILCKTLPCLQLQFSISKQREREYVDLVLALRPQCVGGSNWYTEKK